MSSDGYETIEVLEFEYETIVEERAHEVVFLFLGRELVVSRDVLVEYDHEGRFRVGAEDAVELGLVN